VISCKRRIVSEASDRGFWRAKEHYYFRISVSSSFLPSFLQPSPPLCSEGAGWRIDGRAEELDDITPPLRQPVSQARCGRVSGFHCLPYRCAISTCRTRRRNLDMICICQVSACVLPYAIVHDASFFFGRRAGHAWYKYDCRGM